MNINHWCLRPGDVGGWGLGKWVGAREVPRIPIRALRIEHMYLYTSLFECLPCSVAVGKDQHHLHQVQVSVVRCQILLYENLHRCFVSA